MQVLAGLPWTQVPQDSVLAIPLGASEQHGPHLPLGTDTEIAGALAQRLAQALPDVTVAPTLPYGSSGEHQHFPGTLSIGQVALEQLLVELGRSATCTFRRILFVSAHGGNVEAVRRAVTGLRREGRDARAWSPAAAWSGDLHAGYTETSVMLFLRPQGVSLEDAAPGDTRPLATLLPLLRRGGTASVSPSGVLGDPTGASAAQGRVLLQDATRALIAAVREWDESAGWL